MTIIRCILLDSLTFDDFINKKFILSLPCYFFFFFFTGTGNKILLNFILTVSFITVSFSYNYCLLMTFQKRKNNKQKVWQSYLV